MDKPVMLYQGVDLDEDQVRQIRQAAESQGVPLDIVSAEAMRDRVVVGNSRVYLNGAVIAGSTPYSPDDFKFMREALERVEVTSDNPEWLSLMNAASTPAGRARVNAELNRRLRAENRDINRGVLRIGGVAPGKEPTEDRKTRRARERMIDKQLRKAKAKGVKR
jgi:hypothetical protein